MKNKMEEKKEKRIDSVKEFLKEKQNRLKRLAIQFCNAEDGMEYLKSTKLYWHRAEITDNFIINNLEMLEEYADSERKKWLQDDISRERMRRVFLTTHMNLFDRIMYLVFGDKYLD